jgi:hypothetical protein
VRVMLTEARREGVRRDTSRRHSVAKARNIDRLISRDLYISYVNITLISTIWGDSRFSPSVSRLSLATLCPDALLQFAAQLVYLARAVRGIIRQSRQFLRVRKILWAGGQ